MSLILDALRKLERDKERPDPGVVVVGSIPWTGLRPPRRAPLAAGLLAGLVVACVAAVWLTRRTPAPAAVAPLPAPTSLTSTAAAVAAASPQAIRSAASSAPSSAPSSPPSSTPSSTPPARLEPPPVARRLELLPTAATAAATSARSQPAPAPRPGPLQLMAISERDGQPIAIISDHLVHEGDSFDGIRILRIGQTEVEIEERGQRRVLRF